MARRHNHFGHYEASISTQRTMLIVGWFQYAMERRRYARNHRQVQWTCYNCKKPILIDYLTIKLSDVLCHDCKNCERNDVFLAREMNVFKEYVRSKILKNSLPQNLTK